MNSRKDSFLKSLFAYVPRAFVLLALAGIGLLGNHYNWKLPRASAVWSGAETAREDWCEEHGVPESTCTICHPELVVKPWASPSVTPSAQVTQDAVRTEKDPLKCQIHTLRVEFASSEAIEKAGLTTQPAAERPMAETVEAYAEIEFDPTRVAKLSSRAQGALWRIEKGLGQSVRKGETVFILEAAEAGKARMEVLDAVAMLELKARALERVRGSDGFRSQNELLEAQALHRSAAIRLESARQGLLNLGFSYAPGDLEGLAPPDLAERVRLLGLPRAVVASLDRESSPSNLLPVFSAIDGTVVALNVSLGETVEPSRVLATVADLSRMIAVLSVSPASAERLSPGQKVFFYPEGETGEGVGGRLSWISATVDDATRTLRAYVDIENVSGRLRAQTFGTARVTVRSEPTALAVPEAAIHWEGCCHIAFVRLGERVFQVRKVRVGSIERGYAEILAGIAAGEPVAVLGSHVLKSEVLRSDLGAGCCIDEKKS